MKRKLNFDEDVIGLSAYENGIKKYGNKESNPFLKLLDSNESVPKFEHRNNENQNGASMDVD